MINFDEQLDFFKLIGNELKERIIGYVIGGSAMMFYGAKVNTKDVDLVFLSRKELEQIKDVLFNIGFEEKKKMIKIFKRYDIADNKPIMMEGKDTRFDLFLNEIIDFKMTESIVNRVKESHEFNNLIIKVVSPEDIILLKSATEREKDRLDALNLLKKFKASNLSFSLSVGLFNKIMSSGLTTLIIKLLNSWLSLTLLTMLSVILKSITSFKNKSNLVSLPSIITGLLSTIS